MTTAFHEELAKTELGKPTEYKSIYDPNLLRAVSRAATREQLSIKYPLQFYGEDIWTAYEFSYLNSKGKPEIAIMELRFACDSVTLIESKSLKLYLNSFCQTRFHHINDIKNTVQKDLELATQGRVSVHLFLQNQFSQLKIQDLSGICLDSLDIETNHYQYHPQYLTTEKNTVEEVLYTHLFRSNCPVTKQPDWASVWIHYIGKKISHENLLKYFISFRQSVEFAEQCTERVFMDLMNFCKPEKLSVQLRFTRRGGIDMNPFRSNFADKTPENVRYYRQ